jgi:hypothetical protein
VLDAIELDIGPKSGPANRTKRTALSEGELMRDLVLPAFAMDCRDWLVTTPAGAGLPDEVADAPLLAVLSTAVIDEASLRAATGVLTVGLLDEQVPARPVAPGSIAARLVDDDDPEARRFLLPTPQGSLALLAEFTASDGFDPELDARVDALMVSFHWAA